VQIGRPTFLEIDQMAALVMAQARKALTSHVRRLLAKRNVVGVGLGYKVTSGAVTDELSLVVSVTRKLARTALDAADLVPESVDGIRTDIVETGNLRAFRPSPRDRWRPVVPPGVSVGHYRTTTGTFGCLVHRGGEPFMLSNNHVLADSNRGQEGDAILQPGPVDGGTAQDVVAYLGEYVPIDFGSAEAQCPIASWAAKLLNYVAGAFRSSHQLHAVKSTPGENRVDAALARPASDELLENQILSVGHPTGIGPAALGTHVQKSGRTTGLTRGLITQIDATVRIDYHGPAALFSGQLMAGPMSQPGDSGAAVLDVDRRVVGLLFAGSEAATVINPIDEVLSALDVELVL
jgi:hypothetical protein